VPPDIPLVVPDDIDRIINLGSEDKSVVLPSSRTGGTNSLFRNLLNLVSTFFGPIGLGSISKRTEDKR
jgi:2-phospho-L-lactate guanylyltransferase (CobY/MobA/RfbA family)